MIASIGKYGAVSMIIAVLSFGLLMGCSKNSASSTRKFPRNYQSYGEPFIRRPDYIEVASNMVHVVGVQAVPAEKDLTDAIGMNVWKYEVTLPENVIALWINVDWNRPGQAPRTLTGMSADGFALQQQRKPGTNTVAPVMLTINPVGTLEGEGIMSARRLRFFLKTPFVQGADVKDNPFYESTNAVLFYPPGGSAVSKLIAMDNDASNLTIRFQVFVSRTNTSSNSVPAAK